MSAVRLEGHPPGPGAFSVPSGTFPGESHIVMWQTETVCWCGCPAFWRTNTCRHVAEVALAIEIEARELVRNSTPEQRAAAAARLAQIEQEFAL